MVDAVLESGRAAYKGRTARLLHRGNYSATHYTHRAIRRHPATAKMPHALPQLFNYDHVPETKEDLDWADCESIGYPSSVQ